MQRIAYIVALAWFGYGSPALGQVIQLPSFQQFGISTTVVVPDQGMVPLGGVTYGRDVENVNGVPVLSRIPGARRLFGNRTLIRERSTTQAGVTATIIDHQELDAALLANPSEQTREAVAAAERERRAETLSRGVGQRANDPLYHAPPPLRSPRRR